MYFKTKTTLKIESGFLKFNLNFIFFDYYLYVMYNNKATIQKQRTREGFCYAENYVACRCRTDGCHARDGRGYAREPESAGPIPLRSILQRSDGLWPAAYRGIRTKRLHHRHCRIRSAARWLCRQDGRLHLPGSPHRNRRKWTDLHRNPAPRGGFSCWQLKLSKEQKWPRYMRGQIYI